MAIENQSVVYLRACAVAWVSDEPQPGIVRVELVDGDDNVWVFVDKTVMFEKDSDIWRRDTAFPIEIEIACTVVGRLATTSGERIMVSTAKPWGIETQNGESEFAMRSDQIHARGEA